MSDFKKKKSIKKIAYVHDLLFLYKDNSTFSSTGMPESYFYRFRDAGINEIKIVSRASLYNSGIGGGYSKFDDEIVKVCNWCPSNYRGLFSLKYVKNITKLLQEIDFVVVNIPSVTGVFVLLLNVFIKKPYSVEVAADYDQFSSKKFGWLVSFFMKPLMKFFIKNSLGAAYVSKHLFDNYQTNGHKLIASNVNLYGISYRDKITYPLSERKEISLGFVGGLNERKGLHILFYALKELIDRGHANVHLDVIGGHSDRDWNAVLIDLNIEKNVTIHGLRERSYIDSALKSFDLYIQPSLTEGIPRATLEAMSFSLPVVATDLPGFKEILHSSVLVPINDIISLADKVEELLLNFHYYNDMIDYNNDKVKGFLLSTLHEKRADYYKNVFSDNL
ncbi:glycosyltransferase [Vibrio cyclitrophicus]|uniref:glycosyltransferase n=1 Tax=Vibrio cyclitrophicus TaxID=47951 RepID=UPI001C97E210|nr:glycosyltransferase [Vibrio cyclitrophicus]